MSGGYGRDGYPGQGYGPADYDGDPRRTGAGQGGGRRQWDGPAWQDEQGYDAPAGYGGQRSGSPGYRDSRYDDQAPGGPGYDPRGYGQPDGRGGPGYPRGTRGTQGTRGQGNGGYRYPDAGPRPGQHGTGGTPQFEQRGTGPRRPAGARGQRGDAGRGQRGDSGYGQGGYDSWEQDEQGDSSFLPGFGHRGEEFGGDRGGYAPERDDRRGRPGGRGPAGGPAGYAGMDPGGRGPGPRIQDGGPQDRDDRGDRDRQPRKKVTRWFPRILVLTVVAVILIGGLTGGLYVYHKYQARYHPPDYAGPGTGDVTVQIKNGDTAFSLAPELVQLGVVESERAFTNAAEANPGTTGLEAGYYQLHEHMRASLAYAALINPKNRVQTTVTIPEGKRAVDVIAILANKTKIPLKDFQQALASPAQLGLPSYANGKAEGYLFPATYAIVPHETALQILQAMVQRFNVEAQQVNLVSAAKTVGLTPSQLVTEASLAQAEGGSVSDYPKIAEVIRNRLARGMHLQFDSTVLYGLGKYAVSATFKQIRTPGPYNTYLNAGLPPGPISNPGDAAIQAVLHPAQGNFLYFLTVPNGKSQFSATPLKGQ